MEYLISRNEIPCVIKGPPMEKELHFVIHKSQVKKLLKQKNLYNRSIYIKIGNSEMRCTLSDVQEVHSLG
jgi:hypothetical protein